MAPAVGALVPLDIEKPAAGGRMIARLDGQIALVAGAIPGERIVARVEKISKGVIYAAASTIEQASSDRRIVEGDPLCGGCAYSHIGYTRQLEIKSQVIRDAFTRIAHTSITGPLHVAASREDGYRMRARLHLRAGRLGFFREGTHELCDPRATRQLLPDAVDELERIAAARPTASGEIELSENIPGSERSIAFDDEVVSGGPYVHDSLAVAGCDVSWRRHVLAFFQGNRYLLGALVEHVVREIPGESAVIDLYAGAGLFSVPAAVARGARVTAVEGDSRAAADLRSNAQAARGAGIETRHEAVEAFLAGTRPAPRVLIVDPPRTGLSRAALDGALRAAAEKIVYVSCDIATLARDARRILDGGYAIARVDAFDMFPNTPHVETVVVFSRA